MDLLSRLFIFSPTKENKKFTNAFTRNISELAALKLIFCNVVTKETSQILLQTLWHIRKPQINLVSFQGDSFNNLGYNISQVETLLGFINRYHCVF